MMTVIFVRRVASAAMLWCAVSATVISAQIVNGNDGSLTLSATPSSDESESGRCELHIWPSKGLRSVYHGWLHGGIVDGAVNGRDGYPEVPSDPLTTARQVELLKDAGVGAMMDRLDVDVVIHAEAPVSTAIRQSQGRLTTSSSPCYSELILEDVFFQEDFVNGSSLKSLIRFRRRSADPIRYLDENAPQNLSAEGGKLERGSPHRALRSVSRKPDGIRRSAQRWTDQEARKMKRNLQIL